MLRTRINALTLVLLMGAPVYLIAGTLAGGGPRSTAFFLVGGALVAVVAVRMIRAR